jgi:anhydro-N-acetylmuramic acid kinase
MIAIGLMSGTSVDGVDAAVIETDGKNEFCQISNLYLPYPVEFQTKLKQLMCDGQNWLELEKELTEYHANCVNSLLRQANIHKDEVSVIGFHGQTIFHMKIL